MSSAPAPLASLARRLGLAGAPSAPDAVAPAAPDQADRLETYVTGGMNAVEGWFWGDQVTLFTHIDRSPDMAAVEGDHAEIGVHHGRLFILLMLLRREHERAVAVDVFDRQDLNFDGSGAGNLQVFRDNVAAHVGSDDRLEMIAGDSIQLSAADLLARTGGRRFRLFSVDGAHNAQHTAHDLRLAHDTLAPGGIVVVDDISNSGWPGVAEGVARFMLLSPVVNIVPVVCGANKLVLTTRSHHARYLDWFRTAPVTKPMAVREHYGVPCLCF